MQVVLWLATSKGGDRGRSSSHHDGSRIALTCEGACSAVQLNVEKTGALLKTVPLWDIPLCLLPHNTLKAIHIMLEQEWEMPCLRLPVVKAKNNPISSRTGAGVGPKCTLLQRRGLRMARAGEGPWGWHGTAGSAPAANGRRACSSGSYFIINSASQRDGERKRRVLPWVEVQKALFSHYEHCVAITDNYNLTSQFIFF